MSGFPVDGSNYTINSSFNMSRTANIKGLTCSSNCTISTAGYFLSLSDISVNSGSTLILDNSGGGGVASSLNLKSGNLQLNLANDLPCNITNNGNLTFNLPYKDCIYYGVLSGAGTVKKTGSYNLTMTNNNTISGPTEITTGTLTINGTLLNSAITVNTSANLTGFGSVGDVVVTSNGSISSNKNSNGLVINSVVNNYSLPKGSVIAWSGALVDIPYGWALCDGSNGRPNLTGRFIVGAGRPTGDISANPNTLSYGTNGGEQQHKLTIAEIPSHDHGITQEFCAQAGGSAWLYSTSNYGQLLDAFQSANQGGNQYHNNMPPYYVLYWIIKTI
jgi:microcystin-dependent protein